MRFNRFWLLSALVLTFTSSALASTKWYVNGVSGNDSNDCMSSTTACKTIGHAISLASSGDSIVAAAATYTENLIISISLKVIGSGFATTIIDGGGVNTVITISSGAHVTLSNLTIRNGNATFGGGIFNKGVLTIKLSSVSGNSASSEGGGIFNANAATATINNTTVIGNLAGGRSGGIGGGIENHTDKGPSPKMTINDSTISGNTASGRLLSGPGIGGGIDNSGILMINNSTISGNTAEGFGAGGGIYNCCSLPLMISNSTVSGNTVSFGNGGGGIDGTATLQNSIVANSTSGGNCSGTMTSNGYNLSSDGTCNFNNTGDLNNTDPMLGVLGNYGGPTQTIPLVSGSPAIDAGNPAGCTDSNGLLLKTDQRGKPRPDTEDTGGCDMGAYERQSD